MPSSKGKPTDPKLREDLKEKIKDQPNSDGGGKGQWSAWKAAKLGKEYEKHGGGYENDPGSKNKPKKGTPEPKGEAKQDKESESAQESAQKPASSADQGDQPKADAGKKASTEKASANGKKSKKSTAPREGTRKSSRVSAKRTADQSAAPQTNGSTKKQKPSR